jgi:peptidoglycan hydrolase CwlO-like protein
LEEVPAEEDVVEEVIAEPTEEDNDIDSQIEKELTMINTAQSKVDEIQAEVDMDEQIKSSEAYQSLQPKIDEITSLLDDREMEVEQTKAQLTKYKDRLSENTSYLADKELEDITTKPILNTIE